MFETFAEVESTTSAHRRLLVSILALISVDPRCRRALESMVEENKVVADQEEDPGVDPGRAFAIQGCTNREICAIIETALDRAGAGTY